MFKKFNRNDRGGDRNFSRPEMFRTTCASCGDSCEVPFRPANGKPIYCRSCFQNQGQEESYPKFAGKSFNASSFEKYRSDDKKLFRATCSTCGDSCEVPFKPMPGRPIYCRDCMGNKDEMGDRSEKKSPAMNKTSEAPSKDALEKMNAKLDRILTILELVMAEVEMDAEMELDEDELEDVDFEEEEAFEDTPAKKEPKAAKKTASEKTSAKKPTRGQVKRAKRTGKKL